MQPVIVSIRTGDALENKIAYSIRYGWKQSHLGCPERCHYASTSRSQT